MNDLYRELAPVSTEAWAEVDKEATRSLKLFLAARRLVDFTGPLGRSASAIGTGHVVRGETSPAEGVESRIRQVQPLVELRTPFELGRAELEDVGRGAGNPDLQPVVEAARRAAAAEDNVVFAGYSPGGVTGILEAVSGAFPVPGDFKRFIGSVGAAITSLHLAGVDGPYGIALGQRAYAGVLDTMDEHGRPVIDDMRRLLDGNVVWAPSLDGALLLSLRGGDFELVAGEDFAIGYLSHTAETVRLYLEETLTFRLYSPEAAVALSFG